MAKMGIIHVEKQEIWEPPEITKEQREALAGALNVIEGEYEEVHTCRALPE